MKRIAAVVCGGALVFGLVGIAHAENFQCYRSRAKPKFAKVSASVHDAFAPAANTSVRRPFLLCDSASINGSVVADSAARLSCFRSRGAVAAAKVTHSVTDLFGTRNEITRKKAVAICVPATSTP
jgi:hypothetical protein